MIKIAATPARDNAATATLRTDQSNTAKHSAFYILHFAFLTIVSLAAIVNAAWYHPYGIAYFNQALGGAQAGAGTFLYGTGEGMEQVAAWLNQQPDITGV